MRLKVHLCKFTDTAHKQIPSTGWRWCTVLASPYHIPATLTTSLTRVTWYPCVRFVSFLRNSGKRPWLSQNMTFTVLLLFVAGRSQCSSFNSQSAGFVSTFKRLNVYYSVQMIRLHTRYPTHQFLCIFLFIDFLGLPVRRFQISSHCRCSSVVLQCFILWAYFPAASRVLIHASGS